MGLWRSERPSLVDRSGEELVSLLRDGSEDVRTAAVLELCDRADASAADDVRRVAFDAAGEDEFVRRETIFYFEAIGDEASLTRLTQDGNAVLRSEATAALKRMADA